MQRNLEIRSISPSRIRSKSIGGKVPWEHKTKIWFDEMNHDCIASGVMILGTWYQLCG